MLAACADQTDFTQADLRNQAEISQESPIQFGTYLGKNATRAYRNSYTGGQIVNTDGVENSTNLNKVGFGVFSYFTGDKDYRTLPGMTWTTSGTWKYDNFSEGKNYPNFMYNQELTWDASKNWVYSPVKYWPNGIDADNKDNTSSNTATQKEEGRLTFFSYAPFVTLSPTAYVNGSGSGKDGTTPDDTNLKAVKTNETNGIVAMTTNDSPTDVWVKYSMENASAAETVDLLWGLAGKNTYDETDRTDPVLTIGTDYNENLTKQKVSEKVKFLFKHALAKVGGSTAKNTESETGDPGQCGFKVVVDVDKNSSDPEHTGESAQTTYFNSDFNNAETLVTIKEVKIRDAYTYSVTDDTGSSIADENGLPTYGWFDIETGSWSGVAGTSGTTGTGATYRITANQNTTVTDDTYAINEKVRELVGGAGKSGSTATNDKELADAAGKTWSTSVPTGVTLTPQPLFANENIPGVLLIPGQDAVLYVTVDYFVRTADPNLAAGFSEVEQVITNKVTLSGGQLEPNKYYTIIMHLGLTSVKFEAVVTDWTTTNDATFNSDGTVNEGTSENTKVIWLPSNVVETSTFAVTATGNPIDAKGGDVTLAATLYGTSVEITSVTVPTGDSWLTWGSNKLTAEAHTTSTAARQSNVTVTYTNDGKTYTTPITITQKGFALALTVSGTKITVKDGDDQSVSSGYTYVVSGGDGYGVASGDTGEITVTGNAEQTYTVTVTHTTSGAKATTTVTIPAAVTP